MFQVYVIGCGGIGGYLIDRLPMVISSLSLDLLEKNGYKVDELLEHTGYTAYPSIVDTLVLIDADTFSMRNALRQGAGAGTKLAQRMIALKKAIKAGLESRDAVAETLKVLKGLEKQVESLPSAFDLRLFGDILTDDRHLSQEWMQQLQHEMVRVSCLQHMKIIGYNEYIKPANFNEIIPTGRRLSQESMAVRNLLGDAGKCDTTVVFLCVDNAKTRYEVSKHLETFVNCILINGGNSRTEGHVTIHERVNGKALDPALYEMYPDINPDADKRPDELECTAIAPKHDQIAVTNSTIADVMLSRFIKWARDGLTEQRKNGTSIRYNEVLIDIEKPSMTPIYHPLTEKP